MIGVCIVTYNQEMYIAQAIESVLMQVDCGYKVVAYIGNDCSKDQTGEICHQYAEHYPGRVVVVDNEKNLGLVGNTMNLLDIMRKDGCEYIAMLDGDDYWSDDHKLQKQMAYMEAHPEYGLIHTYVDSLYPSGLRKDSRKLVKEGDVSDFIFGYHIANCSVIFRTVLLKLIDFEDFQHHGFMSCDFIMYVIFSNYTQFGFLPEHTAVWRRGHDSVSNANDMERQIRYVQNDIAMWRYAAQRFPKKYQAPDEEVDAYLHERTFTIAFKYGDMKRALSEAKNLREDDKRRNRKKIFVAHSRVLTWLWNITNQIKKR